jgi:hypothetical protein
MVADVNCVRDAPESYRQIMATSPNTTGMYEPIDEASFKVASNSEGPTNIPSSEQKMVTRLGAEFREPADLPIDE